MLFALYFRLEISKSLQDFTQRWGIFSVARFVERRQNNISHSLRQLNVCNPFPLRVVLRRRILIDEVVATVRCLTRSDLLPWFAMRFFHFFDCKCDKSMHVFE